MKCKVCNGEMHKVIDFGKMPIANGFLNRKDFDNEYFYNMSTAVCKRCFMFQLIDQPSKEMMFNDSYAFFTHTSKSMIKHFENFFDTVNSLFLNKINNPFIVEIGSNDGSTLVNFKKNNLDHLGVEPSKNVADYSKNINNINTLNNFFDLDVSKTIKQKYRNADLIFATNVFCHIPYVHSIIEGVKYLLKDEGVFIFEDPYLGDVLNKTTFDQIYDEHFFLFSLTSAINLFDSHNMKIFKVEKQDTHGGSMRYYVSKDVNKKIEDSVDNYLEIEKNMQIDNLQIYNNFRDNCEIFKTNFRDFLLDIKKKGKSIAGYAATSKSTTILNYCNIDNNTIDHIYDTTPIKINKYSPGTHIPILDHRDLYKKLPDYLLLFAYNHEKEILNKEQKFISLGGKWITYVPEIKII